MPRDSGGTVTLPGSNPVVTGTVISSTWANDTMGDIESMLTDSLSRSGNGGMQAALALVDGSAGTPALTFNNDANTGLFRKGADNGGISANGAEIAEWDSTGLKTSLAPTAGENLVNRNYVISSAPSKTNFIVNSGFEIWQRNIVFTSTTGLTYCADRWRMDTLTNCETRSHPGFDANSGTGQAILRIPILTNAAVFVLRQPLEYGDARLLHGRQVTFSAVTAGTAGNNVFLRIQTSTTAGGAGPWTTLVDSSITGVTSAPQQISCTATIPSNALAVSVLIISSGATVVGDVYWWGTQLVLGPSPQQWQRVGGTFEGELSLCKKYYEKSYPLSVFPGTVGVTGQEQTLYAASTGMTPTFRFNTAKLATPTMFIYSPNTGTVSRVYNQTAGADAVVSAITRSENNFTPTLAATQTLNHRLTFHWTAEAEVV